MSSATRHEHPSTAPMTHVMAWNMIHWNMISSNVCEDMLAIAPGQCMRDRGREIFYLIASAIAELCDVVLWTNVSSTSGRAPVSNLPLMFY